MRELTAAALLFLGPLASASLAQPPATTTVPAPVGHDGRIVMSAMGGAPATPGVCPPGSSGTPPDCAPDPFEMPEQCDYDPDTELPMCDLPAALMPPITDLLLVVGAPVQPIVLPACTVVNPVAGVTWTFTYDLSNWPLGMAYDAATRTFSGTPALVDTQMLTQTCTATATVNGEETTITDGATFRVQVYWMPAGCTVVTENPEDPCYPTPTPEFPNVADQTFTTGQAVYFTLPQWVSGATYGLSCTEQTLGSSPRGVPPAPGLTFDYSTRAITGTPTEAQGQRTCTYSGVRAGEVGTTSFTVEVVWGGPGTTAPLPAHVIHPSFGR